MSAASKVAAGKKLLDEQFPGWEKRIDLDELDLRNWDACILGQLARRDPRLEDRIRTWTQERYLGVQGSAPPPRFNFFTACGALKLDGRNGHLTAEDYGFDCGSPDEDGYVSLADLEEEWREVIEEELGKWEPLSA